MDKINQAIKDAIASLQVDNLHVTNEQKEKIKIKLEDMYMKEKNENQKSEGQQNEFRIK